MLGIVMSLFLFQTISLETNRDNAVSFDEFRTLCERETGFDFCGLSCIVKTNAIGFSDRDLRARLSAGVSHYWFRQEFQDLLESLDCSTRERDHKKFARIATQICSTLERLKENAKVENGSWLLLYKCIERVLYEMARVSESDFPLEVEDFDRIVPERLLLPPSKRIHQTTYSLIKGFRELLVIGQKIRQYRVENGHLPRTIEELKLSEDLLRTNDGMRLHYLTDGEAWHLWYGGVRCDEKNMMFNTYIPTLKVDELSKWPFGGCPNYSSDYSRKRIAAYRDGDVLNSQSDLWRCELVNGKFRRKQ